MGGGVDGGGVWKALKMAALSLLGYLFYLIMMLEKYWDFFAMRPSFEITLSDLIPVQKFSHWYNRNRLDLEKIMLCKVVT